MRLLLTLLTAVVLSGCAGSDSGPPDRPSAETTDPKGPDFKRGTY